MRVMKTPREIRKVLKLSQAEMASLLGLNQSSVSRLEMRNSPEWSAELALRLETETNGKFDAAALSPVVAAARKGIAA